MEAFDVLEGLDLDTDIILNTDDIEEIFRLCRCYNEKVVFYSYTVDTNSNNSDIDNIKRKVKCLVERHSTAYADSWFDRVINSEDIDEMIEKHAEDIKCISVSSVKTVGKVNSIMLDVFISHYGDRMGVSICIEAEDDEEYNSDDFVNKLVDTIVAEINILHKQRIDERTAEYER